MVVGAMRCAEAVKSIPSLAFPVRITHLSGTLLWSRLLTSPYAFMLKGATRFWFVLSIAITSAPARMVCGWGVNGGTSFEIAGAWATEGPAEARTKTAARPQATASRRETAVR